MVIAAITVGSMLPREPTAVDTLATTVLFGASRIFAQQSVLYDYLCAHILDFFVHFPEPAGIPDHGFSSCVR
jgi:hypothetical protein